MRSFSNFNICWRHSVLERRSVLVCMGLGLLGGSFLLASLFYKSSSFISFYLLILFLITTTITNIKPILHPPSTQSTIYKIDLIMIAIYNGPHRGGKIRTIGLNRYSCSSCRSRNPARLMVFCLNSWIHPLIMEKVSLLLLLFCK